MPSKPQATNRMPPKDSSLRDQRFLDEAGDTAFYGSKRRVIVGEKGVSKAFYLGSVKFKCALDDARLVVEDAQRRVRDPSAYSLPKRAEKTLKRCVSFSRQNRSATREGAIF